MAKKYRDYSQKNRLYAKHALRVVNMHAAKNGRIYAVIERPQASDFVVARGFDKNDGRWAQGEYGYKTRAKANNRAKYLARERKKR